LGRDAGIAGLLSSVEAAVNAVAVTPRAAGAVALGCRILIVVAVVLLAASGCAWTGQQKAEDLRADTILKQSADYAKER
jgi:hypothetical protein